jgi:uncharacterized protein involved in exopolysaccharide biosynthesis
MALSALATQPRHCRRFLRQLVERRRFLWALFLAGIALAAAVANSTTLART